MSVVAAFSHRAAVLYYEWPVLELNESLLDSTERVSSDIK